MPLYQAVAMRCKRSALAADTDFNVEIFFYWRIQSMFEERLSFH